ncbi:MAG: flagellin [Hyphomicrobiales bacterium]
MSEIILSSAVRSNLLSLQNTAQLLGKTQERLATGLKVNSALDDPSAFFTASALNSRASDLNRLLDSVGLAVQTLEAADAGISAITKLVESAQASARQALQDGSTTGQVEGTTVVAGTDTLNSLNLDDTDIISFTVGTAAAVNFTVGTDGSTVQDLVDFVNTSVADARAEIDSDGNLNVETTTGDNLTLGFTDTATTNTDGLEALGLATGTSVTSVAATGSFNTTRETLATEFDAIRDQIDQLAEDARFNGNNLLQNDDVKVIFNEDGTSSLTINGVDFDSQGLGITASTNSFQDDASIDLALADIDAAVRTLRTQASTFGSNLSVVEIRQDFTKELINVLESGAAGLTLADTNEEGANLLSLQTRQQLSTVSLSLATQADQNVLQLF